MFVSYISAGVTGCDSVVFMWVLERQITQSTVQSVQHASVGDTSAQIDTVVKEVTVFVAQCYGGKQNDSMSNIQLEMWLGKIGEEESGFTTKT